MPNEQNLNNGNRDLEGSNRYLKFWNQTLEVAREILTKNQQQQKELYDRTAKKKPVESGRPKGETSTMSPNSNVNDDAVQLTLKESYIYNLTDQINEALVPLHQQFIEGLAISHENKLAHEICDVHCQVLQNENKSSNFNGANKWIASGGRTRTATAHSNRRLSSSGIAGPGTLMWIPAFFLRIMGRISRLVKTDGPFLPTTNVFGLLITLT